MDAYVYTNGLSAKPGATSQAFMFDSGVYYAWNPDVRDAGLDAFTHWRDYGRYEGRSAPLTPNPAPGRVVYLDVNPMAITFEDARELRPAVPNPDWQQAYDGEGSQIWGTWVNVRTGEYFTGDAPPMSPALIGYQSVIDDGPHWSGPGWYENTGRLFSLRGYSKPLYVRRADLDGKTLFPYDFTSIASGFTFMSGGEPWPVPLINFAEAEPRTGYGFRSAPGYNEVTRRLQDKYGARVQAAIFDYYRIASGIGLDAPAMIQQDGGALIQRVFFEPMNALLRSFPDAQGDGDVEIYLAWLHKQTLAAGDYDAAYQAASSKEFWTKVLAVTAAGFGAAAALAAVAAGTASGGIVGNVLNTLSPSAASTLSPLTSAYSVVNPLRSIYGAASADSVTDMLSDRMDAQAALQDQRDAQALATMAASDAVKAKLDAVVSAVRDSVAASQALNPEYARAYADQASALLADATAQAGALGQAVPSQYAENVSAAYVAADKSAEVLAQREAQSAVQSLAPIASGTTALANEQAAQSASGFAIPEAFTDFFSGAASQLSPEDYALLQASLSPDDFGQEYGAPVVAEGQGAFPWILLALAGGYMMVAGKSRKGRK